MKKVFSNITVDAIVPSIKNPEKFEQAQIRQKVKTTYDSAKVSNSHQDSLFTNDELGIEGLDFEQNRVAFITVEKGTTKEQVEARLAKYPKARIYRSLSLNPILTDNDKAAQDAGLKTNAGLSIFDSKKEKQRIKDPNGVFVDFKGMPQYGANFFSKEGKEDIDTREAEYSVLSQAGKIEFSAAKTQFVEETEKVTN